MIADLLQFVYDERMSEASVPFLQRNRAFMTHLVDYRRKIYITLTLIFLFIYIQLYTKSSKEKRKQILSPGSMKLSNICNSSLSSLPLAHHLILISKYSDEEEKNPLSLCDQMRSIVASFASRPYHESRPRSCCNACQCNDIDKPCWSYDGSRNACRCSGRWS